MCRIGKPRTISPVPAAVGCGRWTSWPAMDNGTEGYGMAAAPLGPDGGELNAMVPILAGATTPPGVSGQPVSEYARSMLTELALCESRRDQMALELAREF